MNITIITHVNHHKEQNNYFAYAPYVREMNIWLQYVDEVIIVAPLEKNEKTAIDLAYCHDNIRFKRVADFNIKKVNQLFKTVLTLPHLFYTVYKAMQASDHIHLRCPGNMGLIGCMVQILFSKKKKTAKYAGNWDPKSKQPWSYRLQKWILNNTLLTKNMQVLVYGAWEGSSKNIKPFFTATYAEIDKKPIINKSCKDLISFVFVGTLVSGKHPLYAIQLVERLAQKGHKVTLTLYGEGIERKRLEEYCSVNKLENTVVLKGNQAKETIQKAYQESHFVVLPSVSEGWPKVVAEGMFWGCVPIATKVSCVPYMLDNGNRGILLDMILEKDVEQIEKVLNNQNIFDNKQLMGANWSRDFTTDVFEAEIKKLLDF